MKPSLFSQTCKKYRKPRGRGAWPWCVAVVRVSRTTPRTTPRTMYYPLSTINFMKTPDIYADPLAEAIITECRNRLESLFARQVKLSAEFDLHLEHVNPEQFLADVARVFELKPGALRSKNRQERLMDIRHAAIWFLYTYSRRGCQHVAAYFNMNHTTILYAAKRVEELIEIGDDKMTIAVKRIEQMINENYLA